MNIILNVAEQILNATVIILLNAIEQKLNVVLNVGEQILDTTVITLLNAI
jgi:hypothetical protein